MVEGAESSGDRSVDVGLRLRELGKDGMKEEGTPGHLCTASLFSRPAMVARFWSYPRAVSQL
jgi:hypothetical protein